MTIETIAMLISAYNDFFSVVFDYAAGTAFSFPLLTLTYAVSFIGLVGLLTIIVFTTIILPIYIVYKLVRKGKDVLVSAYAFIFYGERTYRC